MPTPITYRKYKNDEEKAKLYNRRVEVADEDFEHWRGHVSSWFERYEVRAKVSQQSAKGLVVNAPTGVAVIDALFSGLTAIDVEFALDAVGQATPEQALLAQTALNQEWLLSGVDEERNDAIKDSLIAGIGWVKVAYDFFAVNRRVDRDPADIEAEVTQLVEEAIAAGLNAPDPDQIAALVPSEETVEEAVRDRITVDYVPWDAVRFDPTARRFKDVRWVAQVTKMPLETVTENPLFREYAKRTRGGLARLESVAVDSSIDRGLLPDGKQGADEGRVTVIEMHDFDSGSVCTFIKGQNWLLYEAVNPFALFPDYPDRSAFVPLVLRKTTRRLRGVSDMEVMERSLNEKNLYRTRTATYIERSVPKLVGPEDALTEEGKNALSNSEINAYVSTSRDVDPGALRPLSPAVLPEEVFGMGDRIDNEIREATGVNELMRGLFPDRKRTATETSEVVSASAARQSEKRNTLERFHIDIGKRILHLMQMFYEQERMARFVDPSLGNVPWEFTGEDIVGDFDIRVTLQPREAPTREAQRQEATVALNVLGPLAEPGPDGSTVIDKRTLVSWFMRKYGFSVRDINELLNSDDEQVQQTEQMLAIQAASGISQAAAAAGQAVPVQPTNAVPPDIAAGAVGGIGPTTPEAVEQVSRSAGVRVR